jgi:hypothetical protein
VNAVTAIAAGAHRRPSSRAGLSLSNDNDPPRSRFERRHVEVIEDRIAVTTVHPDAEQSRRSGV